VHQQKEKGCCVVALKKTSTLDNEKVVVPLLSKIQASQQQEGCSAVSLKTKHANKEKGCCAIALERK